MSMSAEEVEIWNAALSEAAKVAESERGSRSAYTDGSAAGWDAACEWIETRIEALKRSEPTSSDLSR